ncbi:heavy-metal-associated domain-containing protein [Microbacterium sp. HA-8]|uniref:heavy-metal-associated domain-containing protein n=1 Tax=Microbacterium sp. HA-8 TaxID=3234200 RepID=UPI0038F653AC
MTENATHLLVAGMTCQHCVRSVTEELTALPAVQSVDVDLAPGAASRVTIRSAGPLDDDAVRDAVHEAGYELVPQA